MSNHGSMRGFLSQLMGRRAIRPRCNARLLLLVEGRHDVSFLMGISSLLQRGDRSLPNLCSLEETGELVFVPIGGGDVVAWANRLAPVGLPEIHLLDREMPPETALRRQAAQIVNQREHCRAFVTRKRALENYLHPHCLRDVRGIDVRFGEDDDVSALVAKHCYQPSASDLSWEELNRRARRRLRERAKHWLNGEAVHRMTPQSLAERDPAGEIRLWFKAMAELISK